MSIRPKILGLAVLAGLAMTSAATPARAASVSAKQFTAFLTARQAAHEQKLILRAMRTELLFLTRELNVLTRQFAKGKISASFFSVARQFYIRSYVQQTTFLQTELASLTPFK